MSDRDEPAPEHQRPDGVSDETVQALGKLSEALEAVEVARGALYQFHRLSGTADLTAGEAVDLFREAGHTAIADRIERELVGRNVLPGRWTFQVVEAYDDDYYATFRRLEQAAPRQHRQPEDQRRGDQQPPRQHQHLGDLVLFERRKLGLQLLA